jgi:hypothetical protein
MFAVLGTRSGRNATTFGMFAVLGAERRAEGD